MESYREEPFEGVNDPRILFAAERTLLAWVRTGLAMMGIGFVVARFGLTLTETATAAEQTSHRSPGVSVWIGSVLILLGVAANILPAVQHIRTLERIRNGERCDRSKLPLTVIISATLAVLGLVMTLYLIISANAQP